MMNKKTVFIGLLIPLVAAVSFFIGRNYQDLISMYDQYAVFMNLSGDYINEFNKTLADFGTEEADIALHQFNQRAINDFGCSHWIHHIANMESYNLEVFKSAMQSAFDNVGSTEGLDEECLSNLRQYSLLK